MKTAIVPAQVTTVEDKIAGNLSLQQLVLVAAPIFLGGVIYVVFPPFFKSEPYKVLLITALAIGFGSVAIRIKGKLLLQWIAILAQYNLRPRHYVFNKNDMYLRDTEQKNTPQKTTKKLASKQTKNVTETTKIEMSDKAKLEQIVANPKSKLAFRKSSKGGLDVYITEIK